MDRLPATVLLSADITFGQAVEANVKLNPTLMGGTGGYIDNEVYTVLDAVWNRRMEQRANQAVVMVIFLNF